MRKLLCLVDFRWSSLLFSLWRFDFASEYLILSGSDLDMVLPPRFHLMKAWLRMVSAWLTLLENPGGLVFLEVFVLKTTSILKWHTVQEVWKWGSKGEVSFLESPSILKHLEVLWLRVPDILPFFIHPRWSFLCWRLCRYLRLYFIMFKLEEIWHRTGQLGLS